MSNPDLMDIRYRKAILKDIKSEENKRRKFESLKRFEIYSDRQDRYILQKLEEEFSRKTVKNMRKILSINLSRRITDEVSSIYQSEPERYFSGVNENEQQQLDNLYEENRVNIQLKRANRYFKLENQCALQVIPRDGKILLRPLMPHQYDVIPSVMDPEKPYAYVLNVLDKFEAFSNNLNEDLANPGNVYGDRSKEIIDGRNQDIADPDDYKAELERFIVWTAEFQFIMNGQGKIVSEPVVNPIGRLPFIDVAGEKDNEYFVRKGNNVVNFSLEFSTLLSDIADINRLQGHSQAVIYSTEEPTDLTIGPNHVLHMKLDPQSPESRPDFQFVTPSPDMGNSLELLETYLRIFLTSQGVDPKTVSGKLDTQRFSSGVERLLAMVDKFEASKSDFDLFRDVEKELFDLMVLWSNAFQGVTDGGLIEELNVARINDKAGLEINFHEPSILQTKSEKEDSTIKLMDAGLMSRKEAIMEIRGVDEEEAAIIITEIDGEDVGNVPQDNSVAPVPQDQVNQELINQDIPDSNHASQDVNQSVDKNENVKQ